MDVQKQIDYWRSGSEQDLAAAYSLLRNEHLRHALFFAHLALEKILKAHVTQRTGRVPPPIHNLVRLVELAGLSLDSEQMNLLRDFNVYQIEGRYPGAAEVPLKSDAARRDLEWAEKMVKWLTAQL